MESKTNYAIVGVVIIILMAGLLAAILWLSVGFNQKKYSSYTVYMSESAAGLNEQSPVKFNGVQVGLVKKIQLNKNDPRQVEITLNVEAHIPITTSTSATLISQGITGVTYVGLTASSPDLTPLKKMPGEPYPVIPAKPSLFNQLDNIIKEVSDNVNKLSIRTQHIFNDENAANIRESLNNLKKFTAVIAQNDDHINRSINSADVFLANIAKASNDFPKILAKFNSLAADMSNAGKSITATMSAGKSTVDKFSQQTIPPAISLLRRLNSIAANLEDVSKELRQNPSIVIRGVKPPQPGPGEQ
ncbi:MAG: MlaD family protein [bacterium]|nr:MlaD family protein [bacterium]